VWRFRVTRPASGSDFARASASDDDFPGLSEREALTLEQAADQGSERKLFIDNLLVRMLFIIEMIWWTGLAPWEFEFPFPGSLTSAFQARG